MNKNNQTELKKIGLLYHPQMEGQAMRLAERIVEKIDSLSLQSWSCSAWEEETAKGLIPGSSLLLSIGGDGTILRAARVAAELSVPILGINMGKLGFMTEVEASEALQKLELYLSPKYTWKEKRAMLKATVRRQGQEEGEFHALNDVVIVRGKFPRIIQIKVKINGDDFTSYRGDGIVIATATGSTGYALSIGGPVLHPGSGDILMKAISPHLSPQAAFIFPANTSITLEVTSSQQGILSMDGQIDHEMKGDDQVDIQISPFQTTFLRHNPPSFFYKMLLKKLSYGNLL